MNKKDLAVINEMLNNRKNSVMKRGGDKGLNPVKAFKTGPFKFKNLKSLDPVPHHNTSQLVENSPTGTLVKYKSLGSPHMVSSPHLLPSNSSPHMASYKIGELSPKSPQDTTTIQLPAIGGSSVSVI